MSRPSDADLLDRWADGDTSAARILLDRYFDGLARFFRSKISTGVEDLIQQTLMTCVRRRDALRERASFRAYLYTVARRLVHEHCTKLQRDRTRFDPLHSSIVDLERSPSQIAAQKQEQRLLLTALRQIPVDLQIALELRFWEQLSGPELAEVLGIPEGTVRSRIRRGTELLRKRLELLGAADLDMESSQADFEGWARELRERTDTPGTETREK
ncbi:MAG: sigma-70 family RNA polymerase sigma factor [Myxococcota bacterium]